MTLENLSYLVQIITAIINSVAIIVGAVIAWVAVQQYKGQNQISMEKTLIDADNRIWKTIEFEPELDAFFIDYDKVIDPTEKARMQLHALVTHGSTVEIPFKNITSFEGWPWSSDGFFTPVKTRLRVAYALGESILYVLCLAYDARQRNLLSEEDYLAWTNYIDTVGGHPMFLCTVYYWQRNKFASNSFMSELRNRLCNNEANRRTIEAIFPEFLKRF